MVQKQSQKTLTLHLLDQSPDSAASLYTLLNQHFLSNTTIWTYSSLMIIIEYHHICQIGAK